VQQYVGTADVDYRDVNTAIAFFGFIPCPSQPPHVKLNRHMSRYCHFFQESKHPKVQQRQPIDTKCFLCVPSITPCLFYPPMHIPPRYSCRYEIELLSLHSIVRHLYINPALAFVALEEEACQEVSPCHFMESRNSTF
jgi:hypothetical protein